MRFIPRLPTMLAVLGGCYVFSTAADVRSLAAEIQWNGGTSDSWNLKENWDPFGSPFSTQRVPGDGDTAILSSPVSDMVRLYANSAPINGLTVGGGVQLLTNGHQLTVDDAGLASTLVTGLDSTLAVDAYNSGFAFETDSLTVQLGGIVGLVGDARIKGTTTLSNSSTMQKLGNSPANVVEFRGAIQVHDGSSLVLDGINVFDDSFADGITVDVQESLLAINTPDNLSIDGGQVWGLGLGSSFSIQAAEFGVGRESGGELIVTGSGAVANVMGGTPMVIGSATESQLTGSVQVDNSALLLAPTMTVRRSGLLQINGGNVDISDSLTVDGGQLGFDGGTLAVGQAGFLTAMNDALMTLETDYAAEDFSITFNSDADLMAPGSVFAFGGGTGMVTLSFDGVGTSLVAHTLSMDVNTLGSVGGSLDHGATAQLGRLYLGTNSAGFAGDEETVDLVISNHSVVDVTQSIRIGTLASGDDNRSVVTITTDALLSYSGTETVVIGSFAEPRGALNVNNGGRFTATQAGMSITSRAAVLIEGGDAVGTVNIAGPLHLQGSLYVGQIGMPNGDTGGYLGIEDELMIDNGALGLFQGTLSADALRITNGGLFLYGGGTLDVGTYYGDLTIPSNGELAPGEGAAGGTTVLGAYTQQSGSQLTIDIGGTSPGGTYDVVNVAGMANIDGVLNVRLISGFLPDPSSSFTILATTGLFGFFDNVTSGQRLDTVDGAGSFLVTYGVGSTTPNLVTLSDFQFQVLVGDYNNDGTVDLADYTKWRDHLGAPAGTLANDPSGQPIGDTQYASWKANFGLAAPASRARPATVPEPTSSWLLLVGLAATFAIRKGHRVGDTGFEPVTSAV